MIEIPSKGDTIDTSRFEGGTDRGSATVSNAAPYGICGCGMLKIRRDNATVCPNCDTHSEPSGLVSRTTDPGMAGFKEVEKMGPNGPYKEWVPDDEYYKKEASQVIQTVDVPNNSITRSSVGNSQPAETPTALITKLLELYKAQPVSDLQQAKKLFKLRADIDKLRDKILAYENQGAIQ